MPESSGPGRLLHADGGGGEAVEDGEALAVVAAEGEDAGRAGLNAGGAADALGVFHGEALLAKFMMSMPWWQTEVQTLQQMPFYFAAKMRRRERRV